VGWRNSWNYLVGNDDMSFDVWREITVEYEGRDINGSYKFIDDMVVVRTKFGTKTAQLGFLTPEQMAKKLIRELASQGLA
jgi:hypothetical protein